MFKTLTFLAIFCCSFLLANPAVKMQINPKRIICENDVIYYVLDSQDAIPIDSIQLENGRYVATAQTDHFAGIWWCYNCQRWNSRFTNVCFYCGKER